MPPPPPPPLAGVLCVDAPPKAPKPPPCRAAAAKPPAASTEVSAQQHPVCRPGGRLTSAGRSRRAGCSMHLTLLAAAPLTPGYTVSSTSQADQEGRTSASLSTAEGGLCHGELTKAGPCCLIKRHTHSVAHRYAKAYLHRPERHRRRAAQWPAHQSLLQLLRQRQRRRRLRAAVPAPSRV